MTITSSRTPAPRSAASRRASGSVPGQSISPPPAGVLGVNIILRGASDRAPMDAGFPCRRRRHPSPGEPCWEFLSGQRGIEPVAVVKRFGIGRHRPRRLPARRVAQTLCCKVWRMKPYMCALETGGFHPHGTTEEHSGGASVEVWERPGAVPGTLAWASENDSTRTPRERVNRTRPGRPYVNPHAGCRRDAHARLRRPSSERPGRLAPLGPHPESVPR